MWWEWEIIHAQLRRRKKNPPAKKAKGKRRKTIIFHWIKMESEIIVWFFNCLLWKRSHNITSNNFCIYRSSLIFSHIFLRIISIEFSYNGKTNTGRRNRFAYLYFQVAPVLYCKLFRCRSDWLNIQWALKWAFSVGTWGDFYSVKKQKRKEKQLNK